MTSLPVLVTGATDGIGFETALGLARAGRSVLVHGRTLAKAEAAVGRLGALVPGAGLVPLAADYGRLDEVRALGLVLDRSGRRLGAVVHNAGALFPDRRLTEDGWEATWQVGHLAPFLLHWLTAPLLAPGARTVWVSSMLHTRGRIPFDDLNLEVGWDPVGAYNNAKLANALTAFRIARSHAPGPLGSFALHPGVIDTKLLRSAFSAAGASVAEGALTSLSAVLDPVWTGKTGLWLEKGAEGRASAAARDEELQDRLWETSRACLAL